jgi:hypothetical protein
MIHHLGDMVTGPGAQTRLPDGRWVRAVPLPFYGGLFDRCRDAWAVIRGDAYAVRWPEAGELEDALGGDAHRSTR